MSAVTVTLYVHANQDSVSWNLHPLRDADRLGTMCLDLVDQDRQDVLSLFLTLDQLDDLEDALRTWRARYVTPALADALLGLGADGGMGHDAAEDALEAATHQEPVPGGAHQLGGDR